MGNYDYLTGYLTVWFGTDDISLAHKVNGRSSYINLGEGDIIEVKDGSDYRAVSFKEILTTIVKEKSDKHDQWSVGGSCYEGCEARVLLNSETTKQLQFDTKKYAIRQVFRAVEEGYLTLDDAKETLLRWESDIED